MQHHGIKVRLLQRSSTELQWRQLLGLTNFRGRRI